MCVFSIVSIPDRGGRSSPEHVLSNSCTTSSPTNTTTVRPRSNAQSTPDYKLPPICPTLKMVWLLEKSS